MNCLAFCLTNVYLGCLILSFVEHFTVPSLIIIVLVMAELPTELILHLIYTAYVFLSEFIRFFAFQHFVTHNESNVLEYIYRSSRVHI